jgi:hypothetical protein
VKTTAVGQITRHVSHFPHQPGRSILIIFGLFRDRLSSYAIVWAAWFFRKQVILVAVCSLTVVNQEQTN